MHIQSVRQWTVDLLFFTVGSAIYALSVNIFTAPNHIAPGGLTGVSTLLNFLFGVPIGTMILILNVPLIILGILKIGFRFIAKTIVATVFFSLFIDFTAPFLPRYTGDVMLASIFGGVLAGVGLAIIFMRGATTGGSDLLARLLGKKYPHISMGQMILFIDFFVIAASALVYKNFESPLHAIISIFVSTKIIDSMLYGTDIGNGKMMFIMSCKNAEIASEILQTMERGVTVLKSRGAYSGREGEVLLCAVRRHEVYKIHEIVRVIDPKAFIIVGDAGEISGEGFKQAK